MNGMNMNPGGAMQPMGQPAMPKVIGVLVPVVMQTAMGEVTVMAQFGEAEAANVPALISQLQQMGWPLKAYPPRQQQQFGGGGGGGGFNGGGGGGGGGYGYGGGYRPRRY